MAEIVPFRAITYDARRAGALEALVAPPYDVIGPAEQDRLYELSPHNCVRLILNRDEPDDDGRRNRYTRSAELFRQWLSAGVLREAESPALWVYRQEFAEPGGRNRHLRTGIVCALRVEPYESGIVLPHEETRAKAREDRLRLTRALDANPEPIFGLYEDPDRAATVPLEAVTAGPASMRVSVGGDRHMLWPVSDPAVVSSFQSHLAARRIWIADGHHRYETAVRYRDERRAAGAAPGSPSDYVLAVLTAFTEPGLLVFPTHRLVRNVAADRLGALIGSLARSFRVEAAGIGDLAERMAPSPAAPHRFGLITATGAWVLTLTDPGAMAAAAPDRSEAWRDLDVSILQTLVLDQALGIPIASLATTPDIGYTRDAADAVEQVRSGGVQLALLLNTPAAEDVRRVAAAGEKMPPKSTYFYPKLWSGLLMRRLSG